MSFTANRLTAKEQAIFDAKSRDDYEGAIFSAMAEIADHDPEICDDEIDGYALDALDHSLRQKGFNGIPTWESIEAQRA